MKVHPIEVAIAHRLQKVIQKRCNPVEKARIQLALKHPSPELQQVIDDQSEMVADAMDRWIATVLNRVLYPED